MHPLVLTKFVVIAAGALLLASCVSSDKDNSQPKVAAFGGVNGQPIIRTNRLSQGIPVGPLANPVTNGTQSAPGVTPQDEIVFTNPDDPESSLPELSEILTEPTSNRGGWEENLSTALRRAVRSGKPVLLWFTDSARSPLCEKLCTELFNSPEFEKWADDHLIRVRVDSSAVVTDPKLSMDAKETKRVQLRNYAKTLGKRYNVMGYPSLVVLQPNGQVVGHYRGYKPGQGDFTFGQIKQATAVSQNVYQEWKAGMEKAGYRDWHDRKGRSLFAKLARYHEGTLILIEPDGRYSRTMEKVLSDADRDWIREQLKRRASAP